MKPGTPNDMTRMTAHLDQQWASVEAWVEGEAEHGRTVFWLSLLADLPPQELRKAPDQVLAGIQRLALIAQQEASQRIARRILDGSINDG